MQYPESGKIVYVGMCGVHGYWHIFFGGDQSGTYRPVCVEVGIVIRYDMVDAKIKLAEDMLNDIKISRG